MSTSPPLPSDEAPLDATAIDLFLSSMGTDMVLVGGQALAFWMSRYGIARGEFAISNDGDALGRVAQAVALARAMRARVELPEKTSRTAIVAQLRLPAPEDKERNIDVLHQLYTVSGLRKSAVFTKRVIERSVVVEWKPGRRLRVMDPLDVLESRAQNAVGLFDEKGPHAVTQARWAIEVAREALRRIAVDAGSADRLGGKIQDLYTLARSSVGKRLLAEHGTELLDAVDVEVLIRLAPGHATQLQAVAKAKAARGRHR